jgi:DNA-directed RNA polymerase subunit E'/Rpb7
MFVYKEFLSTITVKSDVVLSKSVNYLNMAKNQYLDVIYQGVYILDIVRIVKHGTLECNSLSDGNLVSVDVFFGAICFKCESNEVYCAQIAEKIRTGVKLSINHAGCPITAYTDQPIYMVASKDQYVIAQITQSSANPTMIEKMPITAAVNQEVKLRKIGYLVDKVVTEHTNPIIPWLKNKITEIADFAGPAKNAILTVLKYTSSTSKSVALSKFLETPMKEGVIYSVNPSINPFQLSVDIAPEDIEEDNIVPVDSEIAMIAILNSLYHNLVVVKTLCEHSVNNMILSHAGKTMH